MHYKYLFFLLSQSLTHVSALDMDTSSTQSITDGLAKIAKGIMDYYTGHDSGNAIGMFQPPYYWWQSGAAWGSLVDYWYFTGDTDYNEMVYESLLWQAGDNYDYIPENQTMTEGNDDQGYWGITLMGAAERGFKDPDAGTPSWAKRVENIVDSMISRWDTGTCDGGLRWQIYSWNKGYEYKNTVSNGCLFHLAARLSRFNGNDKYIEWAEKTWDWLEARDFVLTNVSGWKVFDGASIDNNCTDLSLEQWTYNAGLMLSGAAYMYDFTKDEKWLDRAKHLWEGSLVFFKDQKTMYEASCQISNRCNNDQRSFKAYFSRFLGITAMVLPELSDSIMPYLQSTVPGVLSSCSGGADGHTCGLDWSNGTWDGYYGLGEQMSSLELLQNALLLKTRPQPANQNNEAALESSMNNGNAGASTSAVSTKASISTFSADFTSTSAAPETSSSTEPSTTEIPTPETSFSPATSDASASSSETQAAASTESSQSVAPTSTEAPAETSSSVPPPETSAPPPETSSSVPPQTSAPVSTSSAPVSTTTSQPPEEPSSTKQSSDSQAQSSSDTPKTTVQPPSPSPTKPQDSSSDYADVQLLTTSVIAPPATSAVVVPPVTSTVNTVVTVFATPTTSTLFLSPVTVYAVSTTHVVVTVYTKNPEAVDATVTVYTNHEGSVVSTATGSDYKPPVVTLSGNSAESTSVVNALSSNNEPAQGKNELSSEKDSIAVVSGSFEPPSSHRAITPSEFQITTFSVAFSKRGADSNYDTPNEYATSQITTTANIEASAPTPTITNDHTASFATTLVFSAKGFY